MPYHWAVSSAQVQHTFLLLRMGSWLQPRLSSNMISSYLSLQNDGTIGVPPCLAPHTLLYLFSARLQSFLKIRYTLNFFWKNCWPLLLFFLLWRSRENSYNKKLIMAQLWCKHSFPAILLFCGTSETSCCRSSGYILVANHWIWTVRVRRESRTLTAMSAHLYSCFEGWMDCSLLSLTLEP